MWVRATTGLGCVALRKHAKARAGGRPRLRLCACAQAASCSRSLRLAREGRCETLLYNGLSQLLPQVASWAAQSERGLPRPLISSVLSRSWLLLMAASEHVSADLTVMGTENGRLAMPSRRHAFVAMARVADP